MDSNRRNLSSLHGNNVDDENLGKHKKSLKDYFSPRENDISRKKTSSKSTQVNMEAWISDDDLITSDIPTESYWKILAEKRRNALEEALKENERLWVIHQALTEENAQNRKLLDEANSFIEVFKEVVQDTADDTGIDVGDVSL